MAQVVDAAESEVPLLCNVLAMRDTASRRRRQATAMSVERQLKDSRRREESDDGPRWKYPMRERQVKVVEERGRGGESDEAAQPIEQQMRPWHIEWDRSRSACRSDSLCKRGWMCDVPLFFAILVQGNGRLSGCNGANGVDVR